MSTAFPNLYTQRKVAESSAKACDICYKPTTVVLITPDKKDFFYVCAIHLKDSYFCSPKIDEAAIQQRRERELEAEKEKLKKEYEEKQRKKKEKESKAKEENKEGKDNNGSSKDDDKTNTKESKAAAEANQASKEAAVPQPEDEPRVFELKSTFYNQRLQRKRQTDSAKRDRDRVSRPNYFPSVPTDLPGK